MSPISPQYYHTITGYNAMVITLLDGTKQIITTRKEIEQLWRDNKVSLHEAASVLTNLLHLHPSNAPRIWAYLEQVSTSVRSANNIES